MRLIIDYLHLNITCINHTHTYMYTLLFHNNMQNPSAIVKDYLLICICEMVLLSCWSSSGYITYIHTCTYRHTYIHMYILFVVFTNLKLCLKLSLHSFCLPLFSFALICAVTSRLIALALLYCIRNSKSIAKLSCLALLSNRVRCG